MFGRPPTNFGPPGPFPGPGQFTPYNMMQPARTGGFLSRLFGGGGPRLGGFGGIPGANPLGMMNPGGGQGFLGTMSNVEKMIKLAQTVKPMIDQYGPMVKNIPSMLDLLKEYKAYSAEQESSDEDATKNDEDTTKRETKKKDSIALNEGKPKEVDKKKVENIKNQPAKGIKVIPKKANTSKPVQKAQPKKSTPKLYI